MTDNEQWPVCDDCGERHPHRAQILQALILNALGDSELMDKITAWIGANRTEHKIETTADKIKENWTW